MCAKWKPQYDPKVIIQTIDDLRVPSGQQANPVHFREGYDTTFQGFGIDELFVLLHSAIKFRVSIPERFKLGIVKKAVFEAADKDKLNVDSVLQEVSDLEIKYIKKPKERHVILSTLSLKYRTFLNRITWNDSSITFYESHPSEIKQTGAWERVKYQLKDKWPNRYTEIRIFVEAYIQA